MDRIKLATLLLLFFLPLLSCSTALPPAAAAPESAQASGGASPNTPAPACENERLTAAPALLVIAPHPDDEALGFAGLIDAYRRQGKPVRVIVTTDGDAYCEACRLWKNSSLEGPLCNAEELSNFATDAVDSFAEVRRGESAAAARHLGLPPPLFLGYPDTGLAAAWLNVQEGNPSKPLRRSDFSGCSDCCGEGYGGGPETSLTASTLMASLRDAIAATPPGTLLATTHRLDGHGDHAGLGELVRMLNEDPESGFDPHPVAHAVIHAHTPKTQTHPDCWYPGPTAPVCPCLDEQRALSQPGWVDELARHRFLPESRAALPDDADYGRDVQLCLPEAMYRGADAIKLKAVASYASQLGRLARGGSHPAALDGILDCSGYLMSFVRSTEAFALVEPPVRTGESFIPTRVWSQEEDARILAAFDGLRAADVSDGLDAVGLPDVGLVDPAIAALWRNTDDFSHRIVGIAVTARYVPTNRRPGPRPGREFGEWEGEWYTNISPEPFVEHLRPGSVIVIDAADDGDTGSIGSYNILAWKLRGAAGVVTSGGARDTDEIIRQGVPLYLRRLGRGIRPGRNEIESVQRPVTIGGVLVRPGDVVVADGDGVVIVPREHAEEVARVAHSILESDKEGRRELYRQAGLPEDPSVQ